jgi:hypothetical protein
VGQIILGTLVIILDDGRTDLGRRDGENRADHPIWTAPKAAEAHEIDVLVQNATEEAENELHLQRLPLLLGLRIFYVIPLGHDAGDALADVTSGLLCAATVLGLLATAANFLGGGENVAPAGLALALQEMLAELLVNEELGASDADAGENVLDEGEELDVVDGASETEVAKMSRTLVIGLPTAATLLAILYDTHARVK